MGSIYLLILACFSLIHQGLIEAKGVKYLNPIQKKALKRLANHTKDNPKYSSELGSTVADVSKPFAGRDLTTGGKIKHTSVAARHGVQVDTDMKLTAEQLAALYHNSTLSKRKGLGDINLRWTNNIIPYRIASDEFYDEQLDEIHASLEDWNAFTCLNFRQKQESDENYLVINAKRGCTSWVGMMGNAQELTLGPGCTSKRIILHELGHAIGLFHEQNRYDRDQYVTVQWEHIPDNYKFAFKKYEPSVMTDGGTAYDYQSIMHYDQYAFSKDDGLTIIARDPAYQDKMGLSEGLSFADVKIVNAMYQCGSQCSGSCPNDGFFDKNCVCQCKSDTSPLDYCHVPTKPCDGSTYQGPSPGDGCGNGGSGENGDSSGNSENCGGSLTGNSGIIKSPNYPQLYPDNSHCVWTITVESGMKVNIKQAPGSQFHIEPDSACSYDRLYVEGGKTTTVCGSAGFPDFLSDSNSVTVKFSADSSVSFTGFSLLYEAVN